MKIYIYTLTPLDGVGLTGMFAVHRTSPQNIDRAVLQNGQFGLEWLISISPEYRADLNCWPGYLAASLLAGVLATSNKRADGQQT